MNTSRAARRVRLREAANGRVAVGTVVVLISMLLLPVALWLVVLAIAMLSRPHDTAVRVRTPQPTLQLWLITTAVFVGGAVLTMLGKPLTGHGVQLLIWFSLLPGIAALFWLQGRRVHTVAALWLGSTVAAATAGLVAIVQVAVFDSPRASGMVANAITFGNLALLMGAVSVLLHRLVGLPRQATRWASLGAAALGLTASILSGARGGWLVAPILIAVLLWQARNELPRRSIGRLAIAVVGLAVFANVVSGGMPTSRATASVAHVSGYDRDAPASSSAGSSEGARIEAWRSAGDAFRERPITGIGWGNLQQRFEHDVALGVRNERIATFEHAHNQLLGSAANGGLIGVATTVLLFAVPLLLFAVAMFSPNRRRQTLGLTGATVITAYALFGLTEAVLENLVPLTLLAVLIAALCAEIDASGTDGPAVDDRRVRRAPASFDTRSWRHAPESSTYRWTTPFGIHR